MPSVSNDRVNMKSYCSRDPRRLSKRLGQKQLYLVVSIYLIIPSWIAGLTQQMEMKQRVSEPLGSLFESHTTNYNPAELENYSKNVFSQCEKSYIQKHFDNLCKITKYQSLFSSWKAQRVGRITSLFAKTVFLTNQYSGSQSFIANILQCSPPFTSEATDSAD